MKPKLRKNAAAMIPLLWARYGIALFINTYFPFTKTVP